MITTRIGRPEKWIKPENYHDNSAQHHRLPIRRLQADSNPILNFTRQVSVSTLGYSAACPRIEQSPMRILLACIELQCNHSTPEVPPHHIAMSEHGRDVAFLSGVSRHTIPSFGHLEA